MSDIYGSVENDLVKPAIAFADSINVDGGVVSNIAVLGNERYRLIVRPEGIFARMPCRYDKDGFLLDEPVIREYNLAAIVEAIQEINRRTAWMETDMSLFDSLEYTDVLRDNDGEIIDQFGPLYDTLTDLLPALKDPIIYTITLVDQNGTLINYPIDMSKAINNILDDMINNGIESRELTAKDIEDVFFMLSTFSARGVKATIEPQTALLIPYATLVNGKDLQIKIYIDDNYSEPSKPHVYKDDYYTYTYYELGNKAINESLGRRINDPFILISLKDTTATPTRQFITQPYILTIDTGIDNATFIYQMINVLDAVVNCILVIDSESYDTINRTHSEWLEDVSSININQT